jgi:hypothetical protein
MAKEEARSLVNANGCDNARTKILREQVWTEDMPGFWMPPTSYRVFDEDKAIRIAEHPSYRILLAMML